MRTSGKGEPTRILVVGAAPGSFGDYVVGALLSEMHDHQEEYANWQVISSGVHAGADRPYDVYWALAQHMDLMREVRPYHVVYAAGMNITDEDGALHLSADMHLRMNALAFLQVAEAFQRVAFPGSQLVAVSSNSAHLPRSPSLGYCMSKAALSMAVQVLARRWQGEPMVYAYEPGLMNTNATIEAVNGATYKGAAHRMRGVPSAYGLSAQQVAAMVAQNLLWGGMHLNGALLRVDAGEL